MKRSLMVMTVALVCLGLSGIVYASRADTIYDSHIHGGDFLVTWDAIEVVANSGGDATPIHTKVDRHSDDAYVSIDNVYPGWKCRLSFTICNHGTLPADITVTSQCCSPVVISTPDKPFPLDVDQKHEVQVEIAIDGEYDMGGGGQVFPFRITLHAVSRLFSDR